MQYACQPHTQLHAHARKLQGVGKNLQMTSNAFQGSLVLPNIMLLF
jgi:hypothetical protein